ncbi:MAG: ribonuclease D [Rhodobacterales bacterium]|nr:ribonuclease D [Rhodobacterales bacterium]
MTLITDTDSLRAFCDRLTGADFLTVDTEFMRESTYYPQLCLVQVAGPEDAAAIDALADGIDLQPLFDLLYRPDIVKVFHAARQDLEIFHHLNGRLPEPVFDTQVAAMVCGFGDSVGYETLISKLTRARIDKSSRFTDWSRRPLRDKQIAYAMSDVTHLRKAYVKLLRMLEKNGRDHWLEDEWAILTDPATYDVDPREVYRRIKSRGAKPRQLAVLREVTAWREVEARRRDLPRNRMMRDESLVEIAHHPPATSADLERIRGVGRRLAEGSQGQALLDAVKRGLDTPEADCPRPVERVVLPRGIGPVADLLKVVLKLKCEEYDVAQKLICSAADVETIAAFGEDADLPALKGWRREVFGADALAVRSGKVALRLDGKKLSLLPVD